MKSSSWIWLAAGSLALGAVMPIFIALAMISKGGSHVVYCPNLPAEYWVPCMPSLTGIGVGALLTLLYALPVFVIGAAWLLWRQWRTRAGRS